MFHFRLMLAENLNPSAIRRSKLAKAAMKALTPSLKGGTIANNVGQ